MGSYSSNATEASGADSVAQADSTATTYTIDALISTFFNINHSFYSMIQSM